MYKLDLPIDTREAAAIERRRNMEKQRQSTIFNARQRTIGIDKDALEQQMKEREEREEMEKMNHSAFANEMIRNDKIAEILEQRKKEEEKQLEKSLLEFRNEHQRYEDRREFDLNDPDSKLKDIPARVSDEDSRMTLSGMQAFLGEDLQYENRRELQKKQTRDWLKQQMEEKERLSMEKAKADKLYEIKAIEMDSRAVELSKADETTRQALNKAIKEYNKALVKEKEIQRQQELARELDDNYTEMNNHIHGDLLTENPNVSTSAFGGHRVITDRWKGMSQSQISEILKTQESQKEEVQRARDEEKRIEEEWDRRRLSEAKAGLVLEVQEAKQKQQLQKEQAEDNKLLAAEQNAKQEYMNKEVYVNTLDDGYFTQFGTSSR